MWAQSQQELRTELPCHEDTPYDAPLELSKIVRKCVSAARMQNRFWVVPWSTSPELAVTEASQRLPDSRPYCVEKAHE